MNITNGVSHVALTVRDLDETVQFFTQTLGFKVVGEDKNYPAAFVSDGTTMITFWRAKDPDGVCEFDRKNHIGLHHLALAVKDEVLDELFLTLSRLDGCELEFGPESMYGGPSRHMMCHIPGSGIRVEFAGTPS